MNRKTRVLLLTFVGLLVVALAVILWPRRAAGPDLKVAGWGAGQKTEKPEEEGPIDRIEIAVGGQNVTLARGDKGRWSMSEPDGARADRFKVRQVLEAFREDVTSVVSSRAKEDALATFGLDPAHRVSVTLSRGGSAVASLEIGAAQKPEQGYGDADTFVRVPGQDRVYRVLGRDLRRPFEDGLKGLRDRKLFDFEGADVASVTLANPKAADAADRDIALASEEKPATGDAKKPERTWRLMRPEGLAIGDAKAFLNTVAGLYATEYADALPPGVDLGPEAYRIALKLADGRDVSMAVSEPREESAWVKVEGAAGFAKVSKYSADQLRKRVNDLRDKSLFGVKRDEIVAVDVADGSRRVAFERGPGGVWQATRPAGLALGTTQVDTLLGDLEVLKADAILSPSQAEGAATGLDDPSVTVRVRTRDGGTRTLQVGKEKDKGTFYARVAGRSDVVTIAQWMLSRVRKGPADLRNKKVFDFAVDAIATVELVHKDETTTLARSGGEGPDATWKATSPKEETALKKEVLTPLLSTLAGLQAKDFVDKPAKSAGLADGQDLKVTVTLKDGTRHVLRVSADKKDQDPYAVAPTEKDFRDQVFTLNTYQVKNFQKRLKELL
jgi:hypothetical protein